MGQNSTEVSYGFGQLGSMFTNLAKPVFPPKGHVIVAIQFLAANTPTVMLTETLDTGGPQFPGTDDTEATAASCKCGTAALAAPFIAFLRIGIAFLANFPKNEPSPSPFCE